MLKQFKLACALGPLAVVALLVQPAAAVPVTYTFTGVASGTGTGSLSDFTDANIIATFTGDTADIDTSGSPYFKINNVVGTITIGSYTGTFSPTVTVESNSDLHNIDFYDTSFLNGLGFIDDGLTGYDLSYSIGPITVTDTLSPTFGGGNFVLDDGSTVAFTGNTSLTFQAVVQEPNGVPEPITFALFGAGLAGLGVMRRRKNAN